MGRKKKVVEPLPAGFPAVGSYVRYYANGWRMGVLGFAEGKVAKIKRPGKRDLTIPIEDVEIPIIEDIE